jgi:hypothetical protein
VLKTVIEEGNQQETRMRCEIYSLHSGKESSPAYTKTSRSKEIGHITAFAFRDYLPVDRLSQVIVHHWVLLETPSFQGLPRRPQHVPRLLQTSRFSRTQRSWVPSCVTGFESVIGCTANQLQGSPTFWRKYAMLFSLWHFQPMNGPPDTQKLRMSGAHP